jgi:predicted CoA-binding protein
MTNMPRPVAEFLAGRRIVVAGVSRQGKSAANSVFRKLRASGYEVVPINPNAVEVEGASCFRDLGSVPDILDGVVVGTHPNVAAEIVRQCAERGVGRVWLHRAFGQGSVSRAAVQECEKHRIACIVGGCPLMYCEPVDVFHRCMRWWLRWQGRVPG